MDVFSKEMDVLYRSLYVLLFFGSHAENKAKSFASRLCALFVHPIFILHAHHFQLKSYYNFCLHHFSHPKDKNAKVSDLN